MVLVLGVQHSGLTLTGNKVSPPPMSRPHLEGQDFNKMIMKEKRTASEATSSAFCSLSRKNCL